MYIPVIPANVCITSKHSAVKNEKEKKWYSYFQHATRGQSKPLYQCDKGKMLMTPKSPGPGM